MVLYGMKQWEHKKNRNLNMHGIEIAVLIECLYWYV